MTFNKPKSRHVIQILRNTLYKFIITQELSDGPYTIDIMQVCMPDEYVIGTTLGKAFSTLEECYDVIKKFN